MFSHKLFLWRPSSADVPHVSQAPVLMLRPRAWNMVEHNMMVVLNFHQFVTVVVLLEAIECGLNTQT